MEESLCVVWLPDEWEEVVIPVEVGDEFEFDWAEAKPANKKMEILKACILIVCACFDSLSV